MIAEEKKIRTKTQLKEWLVYEKRKYGEISTLRYVLQLGEKAVIWRYHVLLRKTEYYVNTRKRLRGLLYRVRLQRMQTRYSIQIPVNTCGKGLKIMHVGPILINSQSVVGENCIFHINTAVVAGGRDNGTPVLGNDIVLGIGAVVLGSTHVADGVAVGANAVVNRDVLEPGIAVAGVPAKKISEHGRSSWNKR